MLIIFLLKDNANLKSPFVTLELIPLMSPRYYTALFFLTVTPYRWVRHQLQYMLFESFFCDIRAQQVTRIIRPDSSCFMS